jgi:hypothetical protein
MPTHNQSAPYLIVGAAVGAVIRYAVYQSWSGPTAILLSTAIITITASLATGLILGLGMGRFRALMFGVVGGAASLSMYAVLGVTGSALPGLLFLIAVPLLSALATTIGVLTVAWYRRLVSRQAST